MRQARKIPIAILRAALQIQDSVEDGVELVERTDQGKVVASRPDLLLEAWAEQYDWNRHRVHRGVVAARSGTELTSRLAEALLTAGVEHAFTGLTAAWQHDHFATYRVASVYLPGGLPNSLLASLGVREGARGANTWLVAPNDEGVVHGAAEVGGVPCVHAVQVWLDLAAHPERAPEAREHLRREHLSWTDESADDQGRIPARTGGAGATDLPVRGHLP